MFLAIFIDLIYNIRSVILIIVLIYYALKLYIDLGLMPNES